MVWVCVTSSWSQLCKSGYAGSKSSQVEGSITASAPIKLSWACHRANAETVGTEEVSGYVLGIVFLTQKWFLICV